MINYDQQLFFSKCLNNDFLASPVIFSILRCLSCYLKVQPIVNQQFNSLRANFFSFRSGK
jgi:hypothetical protein